MIVDLGRWDIYDVTSRVEYWIEQNNRQANLYRHDNAAVPIMLALLPLYAKLPAHWNVGTPEFRRVLPAQAEYWAGYWSERGVRYEPARGETVTITGAVRSVVGGATLAPPASIVHFTGREKPWLAENSAIYSGPSPFMCREAPTLAGPGARPVTTGDTPCASLWHRYGGYLLSAVGWDRPDMLQSAEAAANAAVAAGATAGDEMPLPPIEADPVLSERGAVHVTIASAQHPPYGLFVAINSTLTHASAATLEQLRILVVAPDVERQVGLSLKLRRLFPTLRSLDVVLAPATKISELKRKLINFHVPVTALWASPLLWIHHALPPKARRP